jgi:hypothetical protein
MNAQSLALLLKQTLDPSTRGDAEAELDKVSKIIGFAPGILQVRVRTFFFKYIFENVLRLLVYLWPLDNLVVGSLVYFPPFWGSQ